MPLSCSIGVLLMLVAVCSGQVDLTCDRIPSAVTECPASVSSATPISEFNCGFAGCYYCNNLTPPCIEGAGCARSSFTVFDECLSGNNPVNDAFSCFLEGCSWCQNGIPGINCYTNPTSPTELEPSPICSATITLPEYDCRTTTSETPTALECVERPGCSWCPDSTVVQCVRDPSLFPPPPSPPSPNCTGNEPLYCFPYPTFNVSQEKCESMLGCAYCANATEDERCMISECPPGWELRKSNESCCESVANPSPNVTRDMSWLVEYRVLSTVCEGFVVSPTRVITAGQCLKYVMPGVPEMGNIYSGSDDVSTATITPVSEVVHFPYYITYNPYHDLMLLKLTTPLPDSVMPLSLPLGETPPEGMTCYMGTFDGGDLVEYEAIIDCDSDCLLNDERFEKDFQACVKIDGACSCVGKIGTPIVCQRCSSCQWYAYGIKSYTLECTGTSPTYITKLSPYAEFLHDHGVPMLDTSYSCMH